MKSMHLLRSASAPALAVVVALLTFLSGCNYVKQLLATNATSKQPALPDKSVGSNPQAGEKPGPLTGYWKLGFMFNENLQGCHVRITQAGDKFAGEGTDDHNSKPFRIENGLIRKNEVVFYKRYEQPDNPSQPPVEYQGTVDLSQNPYMSGKYLISFQGKELEGQWEAEMETAEGGGGRETQPQQETPPPPPPANAPAKPDLSGKWNAGFEYQFKTMHSIMFLEQVNDKITGHGVDENTGEKFQIEKGWYSYPRVTLIRKYPAIKGKKGAKPERRMTFKAEVNWVNEPDYQGPYMSGKTDGGGAWEAQRVR